MMIFVSWWSWFRIGVACLLVKAHFALASPAGHTPTNPSVWGQRTAVQFNTKRQHLLSGHRDGEAERDWKSLCSSQDRPLLGLLVLVAPARRQTHANFDSYPISSFFCPLRKDFNLQTKTLVTNVHPTTTFRIIATQHVTILSKTWTSPAKNPTGPAPILYPALETSAIGLDQIVQDTRQSMYRN